MGTFSNEMRRVALDLCKELGNSCVLTKVVAGDYDPLTGKTPNTTTTISTYSAPSSRLSAMFPMDGQNTNLRGFKDGGVLIPWFGQVLDESWLYNGQNIVTVAETQSQNDVIVYNIMVGEKE